MCKNDKLTQFSCCVYIFSACRFYPGTKFILRSGITQRPFNSTHSSSNIHVNAAKVKFLLLFFSRPCRLAKNRLQSNKTSLESINGFLVIYFEIGAQKIVNFSCRDRRVKIGQIPVFVFFCKIYKSEIAIDANSFSLIQITVQYS